MKNIIKKLLLTSCVMTTAIQISNASTLHDDSLTSCHPEQHRSCAFPFPNDAFWMENSKVKIPDKAIRSEVIARFNQQQKSDGSWEDIHSVNDLDPAQYMNESLGFSAATPVIFRFEKALGLSEGSFGIGKEGQVGQVQGLPVSASLAEDPEHRIEVLTILDVDYSRNDANYDYLQIFPRGRWPHGKKVRVDVGNGNSSPYQYTEFTVRPQSESLDPMQNMVDLVGKQDVQVKLGTANIFHRPVQQVAGVQHGTIVMKNYRKPSGLVDFDAGLVDFDERKVSESDVPFRLSIPTAAKHKKVPVAIYVHGLGANKETAIFDVEGVNGRNGVATLTIDLPNHGVSRPLNEGGKMTKDLSPNKLGRTVGMLNQGIIDIASLHRALKSDAFQQLDLIDECFWIYCSRESDLDTDRVYIEGTSLGGIIGGAYGSLADDLMGATFQVSGNGFARILSASILWRKKFKDLIPSNASAGEGIMLRAMTQHILDPADSANYIDKFREKNRPLLLTMGAHDNVVPNIASLGFADILQLPLVGPNLVESDVLIQESDYVEGYGLRQYPSFVDPFGIINQNRPWQSMLINDVAAHGAFLRLDAKMDRAAFVREEILSE